MSAWPEKKKISIHEYHEFDQDYCYDCQRCLDSDKYQEDKIAIGNTLFNSAHTECSKAAISMLEELKEYQVLVLNNRINALIETIRGRM